MAVRRRPKPLLIFLVVTGSFLILLSAIYLFLTSPVDRSDHEKIDVVIQVVLVFVALHRY